ncbi:MAG: tetratricopeptide repeat protein [Deltaproteobacteria bacterium]|nr:MAG: tetratricopeptide repeat protein [Deltaproteobacteria bacterium]
MTHLPPRQALFGREAELQLLGTRLASGARLVTITGPAGTGKTALLAELGHHHPLDAVFVDLTQARDGVDVCRAVGAALGTSLGGGDPVESIAAALRRRASTLLLLDNFEQVAHCAPRTLGVWHLAVPHIRQVVTSRIALRLGAEQRFALEPLPLPQSDTLTAIRRSPAVRLFVERARAQDRRFELDSDNAADVAGVVRELEGMPLAIELAAARIRLLPPSKLLARLDRQLKLLKASQRDGPRRQETLERAIAWSWELMAPEEARALIALSVFDGGFTLEAAEAVIGEEAVTLLESLIDQSLLRQADEDGRFRTWVAVKAFAKLRARELPDLRRRARIRHADWVSSTIMTAPRAQLPVAELENALAASRRMVALQDGPRAAAAALAARRLLALRGPVAAAIPILEQALTLPLSPQHELDLRRTRLEVYQQVGQREPAFEDLPRAKALAGKLDRRDLAASLERHEAVLHHDAKDMPRAEACYLRSLALFRELDDATNVAITLRNMGHLYRELGQHELAEQTLEDALQVSLKQGDTIGEASTRGAMGLLYLERGQLVDAERNLKLAAEAARGMGDSSREAVHLSNLGLVYAEAERYPEAHQVLKRAISLHEQVGQRRLLALTYGYRGNVYLTEGRANEARPLLESAVEICQELAVPEGEGTFRSALAQVFAMQGDDHRARRELDRAEPLLRRAQVANELLELLLRRARIAWDSDPGQAAAALKEAESLIGELHLGPDTRFVRDAAELRARTPGSAPPAMHDDTPIYGPYALREELGQGGMGTVWRAEGPEGEVAVKVLHEHLARHRIIRERFLREARIGGRIHHPGVVQTLDAGESGGRPYIAMELVHGVTLRQRLQSDGPLPATEVRALAVELLAAVDAIHRSGVLHRDIKPHNVMLTATGPKLTDLGIARLQDETSGLTSTGQFVGSTRYAAPEQFHGAEDIDARADLYAIGVTLYEALTNGSPFPKLSLPALFLHKSTEVLPPPSERIEDVPEELDRLVRWLCAPHPEQRPESAAHALARLASGEIPEVFAAQDADAFLGEPTDT